jgi:hypothetical protein
MENNEKWVEMWDFPNYEISNLGNVRNLKTGRLLTVRQDGKEYRMVSLFYNKKKYLKRVGRYVWMSFYKQFCSNTIHHKNGDAGDDRLENLTCIPMKENNRYRKDYSRKNKYNLTKEDKGYIHESITEGKETTWTIMKKYGIPLNYIGTVMKRKSWKKYVGI